MEKRHRRFPAGTEELDERRRRDRLDATVLGSDDPSPVAGRRPAKETAAEDEPRLVVVEDERAVRELVQKGGVQAAAATVQPFAVQTLVDLICAGRIDDLEKAPVVLAAAEGARPVPGGQGGRLVEEEQLGELSRLHQRAALPALELEPAGDPAPGGEATPDPAAVVVQATAVAVDEAAAR